MGKNGHLHDDEHGTDDDADDSSAQNRFRNDGQGLVDDHVGQEQRNKQKVAILADGQNLLGILSLLTIYDQSRQKPKTRRGEKERTACH